MISWYWHPLLWSLPWLPCQRMVWPEAPGETGPTTQHLLCAPSRMNSACRRPWVSGIPQVSRPTEAWRTSSDVVLPRSSMVAFRCWPPWDTSPQWLGRLVPLRYALEAGTRLVGQRCKELTIEGWSWIRRKGIRPGGCSASLWHSVCGVSRVGL